MGEHHPVRGMGGRQERAALRVAHPIEDFDSLHLIYFKSVIASPNLYLRLYLLFIAAWRAVEFTSGTAGPLRQRRRQMNIGTSRILPAFGALVLALSFVPNANAQCGGYTKLLPTRTNFHPQLGQARLIRAAYLPGEDEESSASVSMVGLWHIKFIAEGNDGIPNGTEVDAGYSEWHSDGTELTLSGGRAPNTGDVCLGVWEKVGSKEYKLNHFGIAWDPTAGAAGEIVGPARIQATLTLGSSGNTFSGPFVITQFNETGTILAQIKGTLNGTRMDINTTAQPVF